MSCVVPVVPSSAGKWQSEVVCWSGVLWTTGKSIPLQLFALMIAQCTMTAACLVRHMTDRNWVTACAPGAFGRALLTQAIDAPPACLVFVLLWPGLVFVLLLKG